MKLKTKKLVLLISTIVATFITLCYIVAISTGTLKIVEDVLQNSYNSLLTSLSLCAFVNIFSIGFILKDIIKHKKKIIILNVIQLFFGTIFNLIFAIINIAIVATKTKDVDEIVKEKKELPVLENITKYKWYVYLIIFVSLFIICYTPIINMLPIPDTIIATIITMIAIYVIQIAGSVIPMFNELKRDFIAFKNNFKLYLSNMLPRFGIVLIFYFISSITVLLFVGNISSNQEALLSLPIYLTAFLAIVIGPLTEELMFRGFIRKFIKNDVLFIIISSLIFGGLHVLSSDNLQQVLFIIPYSVLGFAFSLNYVKTKNIASNIVLHSAWNSLALLVTIFTNL